MTHGPVDISIADAVVTICLLGTHKRNALLASLVRGPDGPGRGRSPPRRAGSRAESPRIDRLLRLGSPRSTRAKNAMRPARLLALLQSILDVPVPVAVLAQVDGQVRPGGMGLIGACDMTIAGPGAGFAFAEARLDSHRPSRR